VGCGVWGVGCGEGRGKGGFWEFGGEGLGLPGFELVLEGGDLVLEGGDLVVFFGELGLEIGAGLELVL